MAKYILKCPKCGSTDDLHMDDPTSDLFVDCRNCGEYTEFEDMEAEEQK